MIVVAVAINCTSNENASILEHPILNAARTGTGPQVVARKAMAYEVAGVISLWLLKKCSPGNPC